jgi:hypothetical protein
MAEGALHFLVERKKRKTGIVTKYSYKVTPSDLLSLGSPISQTFHNLLQ